MELAELLKFFINSETPFMLLFVSLFFYTVKNNKDREEKQHRLMTEKLALVEEELKVLIKVWQILLEKELEARKNEH
jgi:hypothetical protein